MKKIWISVISIVVVLALAATGYSLIRFKKSTTLETEKLLTRFVDGDNQVLEKSPEELFEVFLSDVKRVNTKWNKRKLLAEVGKYKITRAMDLISRAGNAFGWLYYAKEAHLTSAKELPEEFDPFVSDTEKRTKNSLERLILVHAAEQEITLTDAQWAKIDEEANRAKEGMYAADFYEGIANFTQRYAKALGLSEEEYFEQHIKEPVRRQHILNAYAEKVVPTANYTKDDAGNGQYQKDMEVFKKACIEKAERDKTVKRYYK